MKEIELLFRLNKNLADNIRGKLGSLLIKSGREVDVYFYPPHKDFTVSETGRENLRVRHSGNKQEFTYKKVVYDHGRYMHSIENNVDISDTNSLINILEDIGFRKHMTIDKEREIFKDNDFFITIDDVKNLGLFLEIEWNGEDGDEEKIRKLCLDRAKEFGIENIQDKGYLRLLEEQAG